MSLLCQPFPSNQRDFSFFFITQTSLPSALRNVNSSNYHLQGRHLRPRREYSIPLFILLHQITPTLLQTSVTPARAKPRQTPGYIYLYSEDELVHFCWRPRSAPVTEPELDLVMVPTDGSFVPYEPTQSDGQSSIRGRIFVLKFSSSSQRYLFWLQSKSQHERGDPNWFSPRDRKLGEIVNSLLQGEEIDVQREIANLPRSGGGGGGGDEDEPMQDVRRHSTASRSGGAGFDATGGDVREEGEESREGGADGGRA